MTGTPGDPLRVLELFAGIGGVATVLGQRAAILAAVDQSEPARRVYRANHEHPTVGRAIQGLGEDRWRNWDADLWWASPPCQPFTRKGRCRDLDDPRSDGLRAFLRWIPEVRPRFVALENVPGFRRSAAREALHRALDGGGYGNRVEVEDCPSRWGWPNLRRRYYLVASRGEDLEEAPEPGTTVRRTVLRKLLDREPEPGLELDSETVGRYEQALDVVDPEDSRARTACFTSGYGRSIVRCGSYLRTPGGGLRRFSPTEVLRILGFPPSFRLPPGLPRRTAWRLVGNSLSLPPLRGVLGRIPGLGLGDELGEPEVRRAISSPE